MSTRAKQSSGNPAKKVDHTLLKVQKALKLAVEAVGELEKNPGRVTDEQLWYLRSSAAGLMFTVSALSGVPSPVEVLHGPEPTTKEFEKAFTI
ncbi:hypothetical protein SEA_GOCRAZY_66 [Arthrobacter phage GoCrazy]|uniref:Uncharacterized protein n=2 Tax=Mudcatvirus TaxID=1982088 RepID=A0A222Z692_9CAUD|nr:hypothetical protein PQB74_gp69 [Arthrobacter phage Arcadia]YP_010666943.1 hypothetical protein PQB83_gp65 [Arthrobacter phage KeaneyLin]ASR80225.1 hypothetical protein SEA_ELSA_69 [Arthrobacter phage Elsa]ASR80422.1 hypothetical protein SEA_NASON_69 [Arthrobacter phage Nason]QXO13564.1 hypothetical protein SEA_GOCRAZY_66 [Arthrobacter phage GoCrazy]ASR80032.1 hypothetical protein SEA_ARCADIA_69 [Arthrobacter phage Arcadia]AXH44203.1 hypothetical protein SEA_KEANEYLIN_65 [Arthrobacter phag